MKKKKVLAKWPHYKKDERAHSNNAIRPTHGMVMTLDAKFSLNRGRTLHDLRGEYELLLQILNWLFT
jgi:hypothetical protein